MNVKDFVTMGGNLSVSVKLDELRQWHDELVASPGVKKPNEKPSVQEELLTRKEVLKILGVDASTLWRWAKSGYLVPSNFGGQRRYKASDIRNLAEGKQKINN